MCFDCSTIYSYKRRVFFLLYPYSLVCLWSGAADTHAEGGGIRRCGHFQVAGGCSILGNWVGSIAGFAGMSIPARAVASAIVPVVTDFGGCRVASWLVVVKGFVEGALASVV